MVGKRCSWMSARTLSPPIPLNSMRHVTHLTPYHSFHLTLFSSVANKTRAAPLTFQSGSTLLPPSPPPPRAFLFSPPFASSSSASLFFLPKNVCPLRLSVSLLFHFFNFLIWVGIELIFLTSTIRRESQTGAAGGGLVTLFHNSIHYRVPDGDILPDDDTAEVLAVLTDLGGTTLTFFNLYIPPASSCPRNYAPDFNAHLVDRGDQMVFGDFSPTSLLVLQKKCGSARFH